jgi:hypothetical protein
MRFLWLQLPSATEKFRSTPINQTGKYIQLRLLGNYRRTLRLLCLSLSIDKRLASNGGTPGLNQLQPEFRGFIPILLMGVD